MATIPLPPCDPEELKRRLYEEYRVEVPIIEWPALGRAGTGPAAVCARVGAGV